MIITTERSLRISEIMPDLAYAEWVLEPGGGERSVCGCLGPVTMLRLDALKEVGEWH